MQKQTNQFFVDTTKDGQIKGIGKSIIKQPKINFSGGSVKWYKDRMKDSNNKSSGGNRKCKIK